VQADDDRHVEPPGVPRRLQVMQPPETVDVHELGSPEGCRDGPQIRTEAEPVRHRRAADLFRDRRVERPARCGARRAARQQRHVVAGSREIGGELRADRRRSSEIGRETVGDLEDVHPKRPIPRAAAPRPAIL
jgi:hypothetical protein